MSIIFQNLCEFFGFAAVAPETFGDLIPWFFQVIFAICIVWGIFRMFRSFSSAIFSGGRRL